LSLCIERPLLELKDPKPVERDPNPQACPEGG
jgi:hypothetical protein